MRTWEAASLGSHGNVQYSKSVDSPVETEGWLSKQTIRNEGINLVPLSVWLPIQCQSAPNENVPLILRIVLFMYSHDNCIRQSGQRYITI